MTILSTNCRDTVNFRAAVVYFLACCNLDKPLRLTVDMRTYACLTAAPTQLASQFCKVSQILRVDTLVGF